MTMFEEMALKKSNLRSVQLQQKEDQNPNALIHTNITTRKKKKKVKSGNNNSSSKKNVNNQQTELQKLLNRRKLGKSLKLKPEKKELI